MGCSQVQKVKMDVLKMFSKGFSRRKHRMLHLHAMNIFEASLYIYFYMWYIDFIP